MKVIDVQVHLVRSYFEFLKNLSSENKLELIAKLKNSMKSTTRVKNGSLTSLYGAFESKESADEIILNLRQARTFQQTREQL